jgi:hypothetical protein
VILQAHFSVYATPKIGKPWRAFTDTEVPPELGPSYDDDDEASDTSLVQESKVSSSHGGALGYGSFGSFAVYA